MEVMVVIALGVWMFIAGVVYIVLTKEGIK